MTPTCMACDGSLRLLIDLGRHRVSDFTPTDTSTPAYQLRVLECTQCTLVQLDPEARAPIGELYHERYSFKSGISPAISADLKNIVDTILGMRPMPAAWLDIASNDGTLLSHVPTSVYRVGVDPLAQFADEARRHADEIHVEFFHPETFPDQVFDAITSISMFYDIPDPAAFCRDIAGILATDGLWIIQQNYLPSMLNNNSIDNISHEHLAYYSLTSLTPLLAAAGLEIVDVTLNPVNGGCFRTVVAHRGVYRVRPSVAALTAAEAFTRSWDDFLGSVNAQLGRLRAFTANVRAGGGEIAVYGASIRGGTIWQLAGLAYPDIAYVVDRNPAKTGTWMTSIGAPVVSEDEGRRRNPHVMLVGPWWFRDLFIEREAAYLNGGGALVFPLPEFEIVGAHGR